MMPWNIAEFVIGALVGVVGLLYFEIPLYLSIPIQAALLLAGGKIGESIGRKRSRVLVI